ncbi:histidine phosphatase family protein [Nannocystis radixulma]|uniref:Histidine phosphatase family protein n=1 Tax=Nannocystis radixulma TaxID=2995305 RepID=A0ABT5B575_9BACT|nr:histidine phosphatase family protein [Nannocystis radixulma]MDC0669236.1 histidine phosphatase family protein [Nannocystis radixulma]
MPGPRSATSPLFRPFAQLGLSSLLALTFAACKPAASSQAPAAGEKLEAADKPEAAAPRMTVILVRHGEKATDDPRDPGLSPAGEARARALAALLAQAGVTHLFASEYRRTQATVAPLAGATGLEVVALPANAPQELVTALRALPAGAIAVVAAHSNTVPAIVEALGGQVRDTVESNGQRMLPDDAYDRLFIVTLAGTPATDPPQTLELRYGAASPAH